MKNRLSPLSLLLSLGAVFLVPSLMAAENAQPTVVVTGGVTTSVGNGGLTPLSYQWRFDGTNLASGANATLTLTNVQSSQAGNYSVLVANALPSGVEDVLKLSRAQVGEDVILSFVRNSGIRYPLTAKDILFLHGEGVSDWVISAMLDQRSKAAAQVAAPTTSTALSGPSAQTSSAAAVAPSNGQPAPTVYVAPAAPTVYYQPYYYPAYYDTWYWPPVSIGLGFGLGGGHFHGRR